METETQAIVTSHMHPNSGTARAHGLRSPAHTMFLLFLIAVLTSNGSNSAHGRRRDRDRGDAHLPTLLKTLRPVTQPTSGDATNFPMLTEETATGMLRYAEHPSDRHTSNLALGTPCSLAIWVPLSTCLGDRVMPACGGQGRNGVHLIDREK